MLGIETRILDLRAEEKQGPCLIRRDGIDRVFGVWFWPNDIPSEAALFEEEDNVAGKIELPPFQTVGRATRFRVVIVMVTLAKGAEPDPEIILAVIVRLEATVAKRRHVADRVDRPGEIVNH